MSSNYEQNHNDDFDTKKKKRKQKHIRPVFNILIIFVVLTVGVGYYLVKKYMPNYSMASVAEALSLNEDEIHILLNGNLITPEDDDNKPVLKDDELYLPVEFVKEYLDQYIFWDNDAQKLTITTENK